jgi:competence protein ComEC
LKKSLAFSLSFILAFGILTPFAQAASFKDVQTSYRFYNEISFLSDLEYISGYTDGKFGPEDKVTRAAAAAIIGRALELDGTKRKTIFKDVSSTNFASGYIDSAVEAGIISGFPDGTFKPGQTVTRGQLAIFLARAFELTESTTVNFKDVSKTAAAYPFIGKILAAEITAGYPDNTYRPNVAVTRAQFAAFMARALNPFFIPGADLPEFGVSFLNVGQGDAILIEFPNGKNMLVDAGRSDDAVKKELAALGIKSIDTFVATHPDADHIGGADYVINNYDVKNVIDSGQDHTTDTYLAYLNAVKAKGASLKEAQIGENISLDPEVTVEVFHVDSQVSDLNEGSIVLMVSHGEMDYLLTGDAGVAVEAELVSKYDLDAEVLKVSHHGSETGTSQAFLNEVDPIYGILSYGENNQYGHPDSVVMNRLLANKAEVISTVHGTIETYSDGSYIYINQESPAAAPVPKPAPKPTPAPAPAPAPKPTTFKNCTELRKVYPDGVSSSHPAYASKHDRDKDGWACEN